MQKYLTHLNQLRNAHFLFRPFRFQADHSAPLNINTSEFHSTQKSILQKKNVYRSPFLSHHLCHQRCEIDYNADNVLFYRCDMNISLLASENVSLYLLKISQYLIVQWFNVIFSRWCNTTMCGHSRYAFSCVFIVQHRLNIAKVEIFEE